MSADLIELARRAAEAAGKAILEIYNADAAPEVRSKADRSPVTLADERAEAVILELLHRETPGIPVIAEENAARVGLPGSCPACVWFVDPLDGTREFLKRNGEFTVNIALVEGERPVLGLVHIPAQGLTFAGGAAGATRQRASGAPEPIAARAVPARGALVVHSRSHENEAAFAQYLATLVEPVERVAGSSLKFCLIAAGEADLYPRFGPTMEWDTAAGQAVLEAAGGAVLTPEDAPLRYGKPGFRNGGFLARGRM